jgi:hypothetical protein
MRSQMLNSKDSSQEVSPEEQLQVKDKDHLEPGLQVQLLHSDKAGAGGSHEAHEEFSEIFVH